MNSIHWKQQYEAEQARLVESLGWVTGGGILEAIQHIGFLLTDVEDVWHYRREPMVLRSREKMSLRSESGIPYLAPELVLLFKSKNTGNRDRPKDQGDFEKVFIHLEPERRAWLYWALTATEPGHAWIKQLAI